MIEDTKDYGGHGLTIQNAMLDQYRRFPNKNNKPEYLLWQGLRIKTADSLTVPTCGTVRGEFLSSKGPTEQGFDMDADGGFQLQNGEWIHPLRTWNDPNLQPCVEYPFRSEDRLLWVWNVYKVKYRGGQTVEEKWTGNAGFWVEEIDSTERIYHCSHGSAKPPDFESLVFRIKLLD
jgi:hypothetical protein